MSSGSIAGYMEAIVHFYLVVQSAYEKMTHRPRALRLAGCETGSYTGGPANWQSRRWGRPLELTFLGLSNRACKSASIDCKSDCVRTTRREQVGVAPTLTAR
jgi:hypothetical protein